MARYKLSDSGERLTTGLYVQLTPTQRQQLGAAVAASGARLSDYVREQLFRRGGQPVVAAGARRNPEAKGLLDELRRIGNNLNQLSHHANAEGRLPEQRELQQTIGGGHRDVCAEFGILELTPPPASSNRNHFAMGLNLQPPCRLSSCS